MKNVEQIVPVVKELVYNIHSSEVTNDISKMRALLKFDSICIDTLADLLEARAVKDEHNTFLLKKLFRFYSVYAKAYNFLFDSLRLVEVSNDEKASILTRITELTDIDDANDIIEMINSLLDKTEYKTELQIAAQEANQNTPVEAENQDAADESYKGTSEAGNTKKTNRKSKPINKIINSKELKRNEKQ